MYQAVGFDLGETLIHYQGVPLNWQSLYREALAQVARSCDYQGSEEALAQASSILAKYNTRLYPRTYEVSADQILEEILRAWDVPPTSYLDASKRAFFSFFQRKLLPYPDTFSLLQMLKTQGVKIGILTNVAYGMERIYAEQDIQIFAEYIDVFLTSADVGYRKPEPSGYLMLAQSLGVSVEKMAFVGNEEKDIVGANAAGMTSILIDRERQDLHYGEQRSISSLAELQALFL